MSASRLMWVQRRGFVLLGVLSAGLCPSQQPKIVRTVESVSVVESGRAHVLFLGTKLRVKDETGTWQLVNAAEGQAFAGQEPGQAPRRIEVAEGQFEFTHDRALKLAAAEIDVSALTVEPAFSAARDPGRRWLQAQAMAVAGTMEQDRAANLRAGAQAAMGRALSAVASDQTMDAEQKAASMQEIEGRAASSVAVDETAPALEVGGEVAADGREKDLVRRQELEAMDKGHDALEIRLTLVATENLEQPCAVVYCEFLVPGAVKRYRRVFVETLPRVKAGERRPVRFKKDGFPVGFHSATVEVSYFDRGLELATTDAERRTRLNWEEAVQFAVLDHVTRHRDAGEAGDAGLVTELVDEALRQEWAKHGRSCYVRVNPDGRAEGLYHDAMGREAVSADAALRAVVARLGFRPRVTAEGEAVAAMVLLPAGGL